MTKEHPQGTPVAVDYEYSNGLHCFRIFHAILGGADYYFQISKDCLYMEAWRTAKKIFLESSSLSSVCFQKPRILTAEVNKRVHKIRVTIEDFMGGRVYISSFASGEQTIFYTQQLDCAGRAAAAHEIAIAEFEKQLLPGEQYELVTEEKNTTTETEHDLKQQIEQRNRIIESLNDRLASAREDSRLLSNHYSDQIELLSQVNDELEKKVDARDRQIEVWKDNQRRLYAKHEAEMEQQCKVNDEQKKHIETLQAMCAIRKLTNEKLLEKLGGLQATSTCNVYAGLRASVDRLLKQKDNLVLENERLKAEISTQAQELDEMRVDLDETRADLDETAADYNTLRNHVADLQKTIEKQATEIKELTGKPSAENVRKILDQQYSIDRLRNRVKELTEDNQEFSKELNKQAVEIQQLTKDLAYKHEFAKSLDAQTVAQFEKDKEMISSLRMQLQDAKNTIACLNIELRTIRRDFLND